jgi:tetratricopeptide (TPR) repeat protein
VMRGRAAAIRASQLDDREGAIRLYEACLDDEPEHPTALAELTRLFEASGAYDDLARILAIRLDVAISKEERASLRVALAGVAERHLGNVDRAIDELREVVIENPLHVEAHRALEHLLSQHGRYEELATELERRADQAAALGDARAELGALSNLGVLLREKLGDDERARDVFERILARDPHEPTALRALARFAAAEGDIARSAALEEQLLPRLRGEELVALAYSLASTLEEKLDARDRADQVLRVALRSNVRHAETRERLFALCERHNDFAALSALIAEEVEVTADVAQKVELLRRASDIARTRLGDAAAASHFLERASQLVPDDRSVLVPLCELYLEAGRQADAIPVLRRIVASFGGRRVKELAGFHHLLARAYRGLNEPVRALAELDAAYRIDLTNLAVLRDLGILAYEQGDYERAQKTFRGILLQRLDRNAPISKGDVYYYLGEISHKQGDVQKAISMLERAVAEQAGHERARALLSSLKA